MTRPISPEVEQMAKERRIMPFVLVEMDFSTGAFRMATGNVSISWNGNVFQAGGGLLGISQVEETTNVAANGYTVSLAPIPNHVRHPDGRSIPDIIYDRELEWRGRICSVYYGFLSEGQEILPEPVRIIKARMDKMTSSQDQSSYSINMTIEPRTISLNNPRISRYTPEDQAKKYPGDRIFDNVARIASGYNIVWGRQS